MALFTNAWVDRGFVQAGELFAIKGADHLFAGEPVRCFERPLAMNVRYDIARNQTAMIRRDVLLRIGGYTEDFPMFQDTELMNRVALEGPWMVTSEVLAREIRRKEATVAIGDWARRAGALRFEMLVRHFSALAADPRPDGAERAEIRARLAGAARAAASAHRKAGDRRAARRAAALAFRTQPSAGAFAALARSLLGV